MLSKKLTVPGYLYSARTNDALVPAFEEQYFKNVARYDDALMRIPDAFQMGVRMGHAFMKGLREAMEDQQRRGAHPMPGDVRSLGGDKFSWRIRPDLLGPDATILCFGVGTDISFEQTLAAETGCVVHCFDPTPQAMEYIAPIARADPLIKAYPWGVLSHDGFAQFYRSSQAGAGSLSAQNIGHGHAYIEAPVLRLRTIMLRLEMQEIDLLKIDIEGGEYDVIDDLVFSEIRIRQFCLEFDQPMPPWRTERAIQKLYLAGFHPVDIDGLNILFLHESVL